MKNILKFALVLFLFQFVEGAASAAENRHGWHFNFTPALTAEKGYSVGGGIDPEFRYSIEVTGFFFSFGARSGLYYAKNLLGIVAMPTSRITLPTRLMDFYAAYGLGYGRNPKIQYEDLATMYRAGVIIHFGEKFNLGIEATRQKVNHSDFDFLSFGSMISFDF